MFITKAQYDQMQQLITDSMDLIMEYQKKCKILENRNRFLEQCIISNVDIDFPNSNERGFNSANTGSTSKSNLDF